MSTLNILATKLRNLDISRSVTPRSSFQDQRHLNFLANIFMVKLCNMTPKRSNLDKYRYGVILQRIFKAAFFSSWIQVVSVASNVLRDDTSDSQNSTWSSQPKSSDVPHTHFFRNQITGNNRSNFKTRISREREEVCR